MHVIIGCNKMHQSSNRIPLDFKSQESRVGDYFTFSLGLEQGSANDGPQTKSDPKPVFVDKVLLEHSKDSVGYGYLHTTTAELTMVCKA